MVAGHDTDLRLLLAFVGLNSDSERAPPPRKTCPSAVLRVLGKFPPIGARLSPSAAAPSSTVRFSQRAPQRGSSSAPSTSAAPQPTPARDTPIPEQCPLEQFLIVFWQTKPSFFEAPTESERPTWYRRATSLCRSSQLIWHDKLKRRGNSIRGLHHKTCTDCRKIADRALHLPTSETESSRT